ncbi:MerC domain-containing protein [Aurantiacibacter gangjinensis]|uniref:MerC mercury resistance protein n=1 Tax=Aurantiacibacter gangjinensis TaxID=502682 RepID=A0A0G9MNP2_9SPHN|nr:MerC domain-containing protein [Aurantiacibacter gangjinensis]KLE32325.1 hypothetical protein AAW01_12075 [Aurantiacibacter gangjinensis]
MRRRARAKADWVAIGASLLCAVHCALLPVSALAAGFLPLALQSEAVHIALAVIAIAACGAVIALHRTARRLRFLVPAIGGSILLLLGLAAETIGISEQLPTLAGSLLLILAHIWRVRAGALS